MAKLVILPQQQHILNKQPSLSLSLFPSFLSDLNGTKLHSQIHYKRRVPQAKAGLQIEASSAKKVLILVGTRFIGIFLSRLLVKEGHQGVLGLTGGEAAMPQKCGSEIEKLKVVSRRRSVILISSLAFTALIQNSDANARERRNRTIIPIEDYRSAPNGLKYYDVVEGKGAVADKGSAVEVHFDCLYHGITAVSSRESKLLAGNRAIAQPYDFKVGDPPGKERKRDFVDNPNGLFSAQAAPKPPPALYSVTEGMKVGGKRTVIVPPELGYGQKGSNEIPPGATFQLNIELLQVIPQEIK